MSYQKQPPSKKGKPASTRNKSGRGSGEPPNHWLVIVLLVIAVVIWTTNIANALELIN